MNGLVRYARLFWVQLRASLATSMQYRVDFVVSGLMSFFWLFWNVVPLLVVFSARSEVAGWSFAESLVVIGWFNVLRAVLDGVIQPSLVDAVQRIRYGTLDYVLLKPADSQFLVSTSRFDPWKAIDIVGGLGVIAYAFSRLGRAPTADQVAVSVVLILAAVLVLYSLWILVICASFWVVRLDNLSFSFSAIFDAARWPVQVFRGVWRAVFTFVIPLAVMTTYPAMALLGTLDRGTAIYAFGGAVVFAGITRATWRFSVSRYTSASS